MSDNWRIKKSDDGGFELEVLESKLSVEDPDWVSQRTKLELDGAPIKPPFNCTIGYHEWKWYHGATEFYWYCADCDKKDFLKKPPVGWKR